MTFHSSLKCCLSDSLSSSYVQVGAEHVAVSFIGHCNGKIFSLGAKDPVGSQTSDSGTRNGFLDKVCYSSLFKFHSSCFIFCLEIWRN